MTVPAIVVVVESRSTGGDRRLRSFCHPVCCVCAVRADSAIHCNPTASGDGRHLTARPNGTTGNSRSYRLGLVLVLELDLGLGVPTLSPILKLGTRVPQLGYRGRITALQPTENRLLAARTVYPASPSEDCVSYSE